MDNRSSNEEPITKTIFTIEDNNENDGKELKLSKGMRRRNRRTLTLENPKMDNMEENLRKEIQLRVNKEVEVNKSIHAFKDLVSIIKKCLVLKGQDVIDFVVDDYDRQFDMYMAGNLEKIEPKTKHEIEEKFGEMEKKAKKGKKKIESEDSEDKMKDESNTEESNDDKEDKEESIDEDNEDDNKNKIKKVDQPSMTEEEETQLKKTIEAMMKKKGGKGKSRDMNKKKDQPTKIPKKELMQLKELKQENEENFGSRSFEDLKNLIGDNKLDLNLDDLNEQSRSSDRDSKKDFSEDNLVDLLGSGQHILANLDDKEKGGEESESGEDDKKKEDEDDSDDSLVSSSPAITPTNSYTGEGEKEKPRPSVLKYFSYGKRKENTSHKSIFNIFAPVQNDKQDLPPRKVLKTTETSSPSHSVDESESVDSESSSLKNLLAKGTTSSQDIPLELKIGSEDLLSKLDSEFVEEQIDPLEEQALLLFEGSEVITQYGVIENTNKPGLKRAKKKELNVRGKPLYEMQDTHYCEFPFKDNKLLGLFAIFDGHAGALCATDAKKYLPDVFYDLWEKKNKSEKETEKLQDNSSLIQDTFVNLDIKLQEHLYQGCTATICVIWSVGNSRFLQVGNVGDSRAFLCRNKTIVALTEDHKLSNPNERKRVLEMGVQLAPHADRISGLAVTRALGDIFLKQEKQGLTELPHLSASIQLRNDDKYLIVASDGLWDVMNDSQAYRIIKGMTDTKEMANILIKTALKSRDCNDNITVCVVNLN